MTTTPELTAWPLVVFDGGRPLWHVPGTNPPIYQVEPELEKLWREGQERLYRPHKIVQLKLWDLAA